MKKAAFPVVIALCFTLAACTTPSATPNASSTSSSAVQEKGMTGDENAIPATVVITPRVQYKPIMDDAGLEWVENTFTLALAMPPRSASIPIAMEQTEVEIDMAKLEASLHKGTDIIAAYEFYWAGGGFQVAVKNEGDKLSFYKRGTSEGSEELEGGCTDWDLLRSVAIDGQTKIVMDDSHLDTQENMVITCDW